MIRILLFSLLLTLSGSGFGPASTALFDSLTGTWKRKSMTMIKADGATSDMMQLMTKAMPCTKDITYTFSAGGRLTSTVPDACGALKKTVESMNAESRWSVSGGKVTVTTTMKGFPPATYDVSFSGRTMTWVFQYADNPKTPNPTKARKLTILYGRV